MPDITMCSDAACYTRRHCRRSAASGTKAHPKWQSWFAESPRNGTACEQYWPTTPTAVCPRCGESRELVTVKGCVRCVTCEFKQDCDGF